jgi:protease-4
MARSKGRWILLIVILFVVFLLVISSLASRVQRGSVLVLEVGGGIEEQKPVGAAGQLFATDITLLHNLLDAIDTARDDARITGLVLKINSLGPGWGKVRELRSHVQEFRKSKKPSVCFLNGDIIDNRQYYLATACEQVWLVPTAPLGVTGMMAQATFIRGTLDKLGIYPDIYGLKEYKTARDFYTEKKFTPANREMTESILGSIYEQYLTEAAQARKLDRAQFEALANKGPFLAREALELRLVDRIAYWDEVQEFFKQKNKEWRPVELGRYLDEVDNSGFDTIAVVHATGDIVVGKSDFDPIFGSYIMGSDSVASDLRRARNDDKVKAIVLRVDSPGGSAVASEIIRREVQLARKKKPVVVSMSDVAGSGGYWISMSADKIVAEPGTLTGSIGVVFGKMNIAGFYNLLGLSTDHIATSENATILWPQQNFTPAQREAIMKMMEEIYANFKKGVAEGRKMKLEDVERIGRGRVWTGAQGKGNGLVDEIGGFDRALALAKQLAKIPPDRKVRLVRFPVEKTLFETIMERLQSQAAVTDAVARQFRHSAAAEPVQARMPFGIVVR